MNNVPRSKQFDDVYFSVADGLAETRHVFIEGNALPAHWIGADTYTICETGFGTGLNFLAALHLWNSLGDTQRPQNLHFISFEKYPLSKSEIKDYLSHWGELENELDILLSIYPDDLQGGEYSIAVSDRIRLTLYFGDVNTVMPDIDAEVDCWFLDGFKPSANPEMWSETVFNNMARLSKQGAHFATFTAAGFVRRGLITAGFDLRKVPGFGRKREMCVGQYLPVDEAIS